MALHARSVSDLHCSEDANLTASPKDRKYLRQGRHTRSPVRLGQYSTSHRPVPDFAYASTGCCLCGYQTMGGASDIEGGVHSIPRKGSI
eukprot:1051443-Rhodomonas_salina.1